MVFISRLRPEAATASKEIQIPQTHKPAALTYETNHLTQSYIANLWLIHKPGLNGKKSELEYTEAGGRQRIAPSYFSLSHFLYPSRPLKAVYEYSISQQGLCSPSSFSESVCK